MKEMTVFLFEQIMIFAETVGKKTQFTSPVYTYKAHIQVGKVQSRKSVCQQKFEIIMGAKDKENPLFYQK